MSKDVLYPLVVSSYIHLDEKIYDVPCTIPGETGEIDLSVDCLYGFTHPYFEKTVEQRNQCVQVITPQPLCFKWLLWFPRIRPDIMFSFVCPWYS